MESTTEQEVSFEDRLQSVSDRLLALSNEARAASVELKNLKKEHSRIVKKSAGGKRKKAVKDASAPKKTPSGFAKPTQISAELAKFLGVSEGAMIARPDVTKGISSYIKENKLQKEENKRVIDLTKPGGEALVKLLNIPSGDELTFFNLQKYLKIHFPRPEEKATSAAVAAPAQEPVEEKKKKKSEKKTAVVA